MGSYFNGGRPDLNTPEGQELYRLLREGHGQKIFDASKGGLAMPKGNKYPEGTYVYAEKNGQSGYMIPGRSETWVKDPGTSPYTKTAQKRHALLNPPQSDSKPQQSRPVASLSERPPAPQPTNYVGTGGVEYDVSTGRPVGAPEKGYSLGDDGKMTAHKPPKPEESEETGDGDGQKPAPVSEADDGDGTVRTNENGITQKGMNLGGIQNFIKFNPDLKIADGADFFNFSSTKSPDAYKGEDNTVSTKDTGYTIPKGSTPIVGAKAVKGGDLKIGTGDSGGYTIPPASVPGTTGHTPEDPQAGISSAPDSADQTRGISFNSGYRSRKDPRNRGGGADEPFGGVEPSNESLVSPMYKDKARSAYSRGFLDSTSKGPMGVLRDASAAQGVIRTNDGGISIRKGDSYITYTGDKSAREVAYDLGGGQRGYDKHAGDFTTIQVPDKPEVKPDDEQTTGTITPTPQQSGIKPGTIKPQPNEGGSFESPEPITRPDTSRIEEATSFLTKYKGKLTQQ